MRAGGLKPAELTAILRPWRAFGLPIYRQIARHLELPEGAAAVIIGCGSGDGAFWLAERSRVNVEGVDPDPRAVARADARARRLALSPPPTFQVIDPADLPYEAGVFDAAIIDLLALGGDAEGAALAEAARVVKAMGLLFCVTPTWLGEPAQRHRRRISAEAAVQPRHVMEWKQLLREAGVVELTVAEAGADGAWLETSILLVLFRAWRAARWRGLRFALGSTYRAMRAAAVGRTLGLSLIWGAKWPHPG